MKTDKSFTWKPKDLFGLDPLDVLIVGGTNGLGRAIAQTLSLAGASVTVVGRTFRDQDKKNIKFIKADLSSIKESQQIAKNLDVSKSDIVLFTAGIFSAPKREENPEGLERDLAVSFLNRLAMIRIIAPKLLSKKDNGFTPRVFNMAFPGNDQLGVIDDLNLEKKYSAYQAHMNTVAANEALVYESTEKYKGVNFYGLNPGLVKTGIRNNYLGENSLVSNLLETVLGWFTYTPEQYATKITPLLIAPELDSRNGGIFNNVGDALVPSKGMTPEYASKLISQSASLLESKGIDLSY